jgi:predicted TIM-barrel fold metal-dependent hydrolase
VNRRPAQAAVAILLSWSLAAAAAAPEKYYGAGDFRHLQKIDAHVHVHGPADRLMGQAVHDNFRLLTINVDYPDFPPLAEQRREAVSLRDRYPGRVAFVGSFSVTGFPSPVWEQTARTQVATAQAQGAVGIKIWKNIGMALKDPDGHYVMPDDPRLAPIITLIEQRHLVLLGHQAEPLNCWLAPNKMTVRSDREYFAEHPQYYMYQHPEMPSHDAILAARDRMLAAHPALKFEGVHLASLEWDVDQVASFLERFPTAHVDLAARMVHLEYQAAQNRARVRAFLLRFQDRIVYGSDDAYGPKDSDPMAVTQVHRDWLADWEFLTSDHVMHSGDFRHAFQGLHLPRSAVDKIYRDNAEALFPGAWDAHPVGAKPGAAAAGVPGQLNSPAAAAGAAASPH